LEGRYRPLVRFDEGVYAVDSVMRRECPTEDCPSEGHIEWWWKIGGLMDLTKRDTERPLYAKQDRETGEWKKVDPPESDGSEVAAS